MAAVEVVAALDPQSLSEAAVAAVPMQKTNTLIAEIELVCFPARRQRDF